MLEENAWYVLAFALLTLIAVFGYGGYLYLMIAQKKNEFAVFYILGMTRKKMIAVIFSSGAILLAVSFGIAVLSYPWGEYGKELGVIVDEAGAIAGVNGGIYYSSGNKGGRPYGVTVSNGEIQDITLGWSGLYLIGFDENNLLRIISLEGMNKSAVEKMVKEEKIRDAISFQEESSDANNHFVKLIINGEKRELSGKGSGQNPRTAIGQRKDGSVLILVTDGRGKNGHLGATASDLIEIMAEYGAVNAANVDGGSSSSLYYNKKYLRTSVTFYYTNSSWRLPTAFVVKDN